MADGQLVSIAEATDFVKRCIVSLGAPEEHATSLADVLVTADYRGHFSHGLDRTGIYVKKIKQGTVDPRATPLLVKETTATAFVDGRNAIGPVIGTYCMDLAIEKAKEAGIAWVTCTGSNHYGIAGYYSLRAIKAGLIGMSATNTSPLVFPTRAKEYALGTNPLSFGAPGKDGDSFVLDMATSAVAYGKVKIQQNKGEPIPNGWAIDRHGKETNDPEEVLSGGLLPLGGSELTSGYKGYGLSMMVETMCGILGGGPFGSHIRKWWEADCGIANLGQTFVAVNPECFAPGFTDHMQKFMDEMRGLEPTDDSAPVKVAGDLSRSRMKTVDDNGGILYHDAIIKKMNELALELGVEPIKTID